MSVTQISAQDAFEILKKDPESVLLDVRTPEEFNFVGTADPSEFNNRMILLPWKFFPQMTENPNFSADLENSLQKLFAKNFLNAKIIFMCKTGGRSSDAANHALNLGYKNCFNLISGFEGDLNQSQQRGHVNGWKASKLAWRQK